MQELLDMLRALNSDLENTSSQDWDIAGIGGKKALPTIAKNLSEHLDEFKRLMNKPIYPRGVKSDIIVDTQILSYRFKGLEDNIHGRSLAISSITANEFLTAQPKDSKQPNYYIIHPARYPYLLEGDGSQYFGNPKWAKMGAHRTDQVIIDFGNHFSAYREFGNEAISQIINENKLYIYKQKC